MIQACVGTSHVHKYTLRGNENITVLISLTAIVFDGHFPFACFLIPVSTENLGIELEVSVQVPFLDSALDVGEDLRTTGIEPLPIWVRVERKRLVLLAIILRSMKDSRHSRKYVLGHRIGHQDSDWRATFRQHRLEPRKSYARLCFAWQETCAGTCAP
jgi:hypothetical protein